MGQAIPGFPTQKETNSEMLIDFLHGRTLVSLQSICKRGEREVSSGALKRDRKTGREHAGRAADVQPADA